jgi:hypothetical protein
MVIRELRVDLPGETTSYEDNKRIDERANEVYEQLTEGVPAAAAGVVAEELAAVVKETEEGRTTLSAEIAAVTPNG